MRVCTGKEEFGPKLCFIWRNSCTQVTCTWTAWNSAVAEDDFKIMRVCMERRTFARSIRLHHHINRQLLTNSFTKLMIGQLEFAFLLLPSSLGFFDDVDHRKHVLLLRTEFAAGLQFPLNLLQSPVFTHMLCTGRATKLYESSTNSNSLQTRGS